MTETKQLNKQMPEEENSYKPLKELNLLDDFLFDVTTMDLEACKIIIELSLGMNLKSIRWKEGQKVVHNLPGKRGIRMDFCVEDGEGNLIDVEMQKRNEGNIPKRTRFYQALTDAPILKSGEKGFDNLPPCYMVIICGFDLYHKGKYRYTFEHCCKEVPGLPLGDECQKIILNTRGTNDDEVDRTLADFLHYVENSREEELPGDCDVRLRHLHSKIAQIKLSDEMEAAYMRTEEWERLIKEKGERIGIEKGEIQIICRNLQKGRTAEEIADFLGKDLAGVQEICRIAETSAPEYDMEKIYRELKSIRMTSES